MKRWTVSMVVLMAVATHGAHAAGLPGQSGARGGFAQFQGQGQGDRWRNGQAVEALRTPYTVRTGAVIPALLLTAINSDLPGQITGQVSQDVYDSATGHHLLIPQGSRLIGQYSSDVALGQERVMFAWQRIVFPDGRALDIGAMPGADGAGVSGVSDYVDNHYVRIFGSALLLSIITTGFKAGLPEEQQDARGRKTLSGAASESISENFGGTASEMIRGNMNIAPTLKVRAGFRVNVMVTRDLEVPGPYEDGRR